MGAQRFYFPTDTVHNEQLFIICMRLDTGAGQLLCHHLLLRTTSLLTIQWG